ncbi:DUF1272 domain-containing protein, partial [Nocardia elegans]
MKSRCELCGATLRPDGEAWICASECTDCPTCHPGLDSCPNCAGELVP